MRYLPQIATSVDDRFNNGRRPPMDLIPPALRKLIQERDRILEQCHVAEQHRADLASERHDVAAQAADSQAAADAARAGQDIPAASAAADLAQSRETADRALVAQRDALAAVTNDCDNLASDLFWNQPSSGKDADKAREAAEALAAQLAEVIEAAVVKRATHDWLRTGAYYPRAAVAACDVIPDLKRRGVGRHDVKAPTVREVITATTTAALTDEEN